MSDENTSVDPKMAQEIAALDALENQPFVTGSWGYIKRTGPGLLQSAMTLGAGSAAASVIAGASFGYKLLWVQPVAMFLGVMMLSALSNVVLTTGERPYKSFWREIGGWLAILWALGTIMSSVIWHFPQYGLAASAARDLADLGGVSSAGSTIVMGWELSFSTAGLIISFGIGLAILCINVVTTFNYGGDSRGVRIYEWFLRGCIALVVLMFGIVCVAKIGDIKWIEVGKGFIGYYGIPNLFLEDGTLNQATVTQVLGMLGAAVGINMTFLYPYSLLKKGWGKSHRKLAKWDLGMTMFLPFVLVTSLVIIAMTVGGVYDGSDVVNTTIKPIGAAKALGSVLGDTLGRTIFDLGLIGMTCGAISTHMVVCGFTFCEMLGLEQTKWRFRIFALAPAIGILGVIVNLPIWFPVAASAVCFTMLPIAYLAFLIMSNKRSYLGDAVGSGLSRIIFNAILIVALLVATIGSLIKIKGGVIDKIWTRPAAEAVEVTEPETSDTPAAVSDPQATSDDQTIEVEEEMAEDVTE